MAYFEFSTSRVVHRLLRSLPASPRCGMCGAPFAGVGSRLVRPLGYRPSRKNPTLCATCVELAPPGGITTEVGVLFADLRGFTARSESITPQEASAVLRRFYAVAEEVLLPNDRTYKDDVRREWTAAATGWRKWIDTIEGETAGRVVNRALLEQAGVRRGDHVLDVGSGYGEPGLTAAQAVGPTGHVTCLDISADMLAFAEERSRSCGLANVTFVEGDIETTELEPAVSGKTMPTARMPLPMHVHADCGVLLAPLAGPRLFLPKRGDRDVVERGRGDPHHRLRDLRESQIRCGAVDFGAPDGGDGRRQPGRRRFVIGREEPRMPTITII